MFKHNTFPLGVSSLNINFKCLTDVLDAYSNFKFLVTGIGKLNCVCVFRFAEQGHFPLTETADRAT